MNHVDLYNLTALKCSKLITKHYSTSFTLGIQTLAKKLHYPIYAIYGYVRYADEIVDTFHQHDKKLLLDRFKQDTYTALEDQISLNPVIHAFQMIVRQYDIDYELIESFLHSMEMDLYESSYTDNSYETYIYGSAEVVGLMCLTVFCDGDKGLYNELKDSARSLGAAFQKVNFLRDMKDDYYERGRTYFPDVDLKYFDNEAKAKIEADIQKDFDHAYQGIIRLPRAARSGVYLAYIYYLNLFRKIKKASTATVLAERIRVADSKKAALLVSTYFKSRFNYI